MSQSYLALHEKNIGLAFGFRHPGRSEFFRLIAVQASTEPASAGEFMAISIAILDYLFGCHHAHLSRVFTLQRESYKVCCDCGAKFAYSLEAMSIERRVPLDPLLTRFRVA